MKKQLLLFFMMLLPMVASANTIEVDGIYYKLSVFGAGPAEVTSNPNKYAGSVVIPESVVYEGKNYSVTSIGQGAFSYCSDLTSVTIPNSVTSIGGSAFFGCSGLTSVHITDIAAWCNIKFDDRADNPLWYAGHLYLNGKEVRDLVIPNNVISIGSYAFYGYSGLTSVTIPNSVTSIGSAAFQNCSGLTSLTIGNSVTYIGNWAFSGCSGLTSIEVESGNPNYDSRNNCNAIIETSSNTLIAGCQSTIIPNTVTSIGGNAFQDCRGLTSVTIPNSVTSIGVGAFNGCSGLTSVTIPNSVTSIGNYAFWNCIGLTSVTIPNSVTSIGGNAFLNCSGLTSMTIPNSVTSIGDYAFDGCSAIQFVKSFITEPYSIKKNVFPDEIYRQGTLFIPAGTERLYSRYDGWREFLKIVEMDGTEVPDIPGADKCATPTISYQFGQLSFSCETEDVTFVSEITDYDIKKSYDASLYLTATYYISVYATKDGYNNSDVATATLSWMDAELFTDDISGGAATVRAKAVLIQSNGSMLSIAGADEGTAISVYDVSGKMVGSATAASENTNISTSLHPGDIALVKIGDKTIKVLIK